MKHQTSNGLVHILLISPYFHPHIGGSQRYAEELYVHLIKQQKNVQVTVLAYNTDHAPARESYRGLSIIRIPCWQILPGQFALPHPIALLSVLFSLASKHFDYVHTHIRYFDATWWAWIFARAIGAKSIFTEHVANHPVHQSRIVVTTGTLIDKTIATFSINRYDIVTTTNSPAKEFLTDTLGIKRPIYVSYGGVDTKFYSQQKIKKHRIPNTDRKFSQNSIFITYAGRVIWSKGVTYLVNAIKALNDLPPYVHFVIAGSGTSLTRVKNSIASFALSDRVTVTGGLQPKEVRNLLRSTDIFIYPSHHNEGFPNAILEAGASGCFIIATNNAGTNEIITGNDMGLLIQGKSVSSIKNAIHWAISHPRERHEKAMTLRAYIQEHFEWKTIASSFFTLIQTAAMSENRAVIAPKIQPI